VTSGFQRGDYAFRRIAELVNVHARGRAGTGWVDDVRACPGRRLREPAAERRFLPGGQLDWVAQNRGSRSARGRTIRGRGATTEDKRSACVALAGVLERRRALLKEELFKKDEGALFQIANEFGLRHRAAGQKGDYDPVFLDWVFWWFLGTVELTDRLLARQAAH
jgi:hypothetical protein